MANDAIEAIKQVELNAEQMKNAANKKAQVAVARAKTEAEKLQNTILRQARSKASLKIGIEKDRATRISKTIRYQAEQDAEKIKNISEDKLKEAIQLVLQRVLSK